MKQVMKLRRAAQVLSAGAILACTSLPASALVIEYISNTQAWSSDDIFNSGFGHSITEGAVGHEGHVTTTVGTHAGAATLSYDLDTCCGGHEFVRWNGVDIVGSFQSGDAFAHYSFNLTALGNDVLQFVGQNDPSFNHANHISVTQVPEPASLALLGLGLAGLAATRRALKK